MVECLVFEPERRYTQDQLEAVLPELKADLPVELQEGKEPGLERIMQECLFLQTIHMHQDDKTVV